MKTKLIILISIIFLASNLWAENSKSSQIIVGAALPLTGNLATYGNLIRQGSEMAIEDLKAQGVDVSYVAEQAPFSGPEVISAFRSLVESSKIQGIAGNFSNVSMLSIAPELSKNKIVAMHTAAVDADILAASKGWIFSTNTRVQDEAEHLAQYAYTSGARKVGIITIQTNFGEGYRKFFMDKFLSLGGKIVADEYYQITDTDYRAQLARVKSHNPDLVFAASFGHFLGLTLKQAREIGISAEFLSTYESEDSSMTTSAGKHADGLKYFISFDPSAGTASGKFIERFKKQYAQHPGTFALNAYDATTILVQGLKLCQENSDCLKKYLLNIKDYQGVSGEFSINSQGTADKKFYLRTISNGQFISVE